MKPKSEDIFFNYKSRTILNSEFIILNYSTVWTMISVRK